MNFNANYLLRVLVEKTRLTMTSNPVCRMRSIHTNPKKNFLALRMTTLLLFSACLSAGAGGLPQRVTLSASNVKLGKVFKEIKKQTGYVFVCDARIMEEAKPISIHVKNRTVEEVLKECLQGQPLDYSIQEKTVKIVQKEISYLTTTPGSVLTRYEENIPPIPLEIINGTVKDSLGNPLASVSIIVKRTKKGTSTDANGHFSIEANVGDVLEFTFVGYQKRKVTVGQNNNIAVVMDIEVTIGSEIVITALGIKETARSTTYATQTISGEQVNAVKDPNFMNSLTGKAAGVVITEGNAGPGASARVIIRGSKSITGNNQPLYVIDGVPMSNVSSAQSSSLDGTNLRGPVDNGDAISNLNPEDIESISILRGASASALYGSQAANGVVLITTKSAVKGVSAVNFTSTVTLSKPLILPELQTSYGQGSGGVPNTAVNDSWGPKITDGSDAFLNDFFQTGHSYINSVSVANGNNKIRYYLSYANTHANAIIPNDTYNRNNLTIKENTQLFNNKVSVTASLNYIDQDFKNRPAAGFRNSPLFGLYLFPVGDNFSKYSGSNYQKFDSTRNMYVQNWPYTTNEHSSNQNPYWIQNKIQNEGKRNRAILDFSAEWHVNNWIKLTARATYDRSQDSYERRAYASSDPIIVGKNGSYTTNPSTTQQFYSDLLLSGDRKLTKDLSLSMVLGTSVTKDVYHSVLLTTNGPNTTLYYPNFFSVYGLNGNFVHQESLQERLSQAVFGTATMGFKNTLFVNVTSRNEWSSTVNESFFYPAFGFSYVITNTLGTSNLFSFAKIRASYAEVGNALPFGVADHNPNYSLSPNGNINGRGSLPFFNGTDTVNLKPERTRSYEFGGDFRLFRNKLSLGITYYNATSFDQAFQIAAPAGAGASSFWINGGTILNKGVEALVNYQVNFRKLRWTPGLTFSRNINQIRKLSDLLKADRFVLSSDMRLVQLFLVRPGSPNLHGAKKYGSYGDIFGRTYQRDDNGKMKYGTDGLPLLSSSNDQYLGNANPDFLLGFTNSFNYKNFRLSFLIDSRFGGKIASSTQQWLDFKGLSKRTGVARNNGGVMINGQKIDAEAYYGFTSGNADVAAATEEYVYDATNIRLRTLSIGYDLPVFSDVIKKLSISLQGRNLFFFYKNAPFDPDVSISTNNALVGVDAFQLPSTRSYDVTLNVTF